MKAEVEKKQQQQQQQQQQQMQKQQHQRRRRQWQHICCRVMRATTTTTTEVQPASQSVSQPATAITACFNHVWAAAHPDVTWPLSTPSSSGLARCARETLVTSPPWAVQQLCSPESGTPGSPGRERGSGSSENGSESAQAEPPAVQLLR
ncbi:hypothetical protein TYRP_016290 [Tyrophagus putrescentiae]|nr:hypothetical protein TYRP_016290 [Tyrophagus putrescentiae]